MTTPHRFSVALLAAAATAVLAMGCTAGSSTPPAPTAADAKAFLDTVNQTMLKLGVLENQAGWVAQNFITDDTEALSARINQQYIDAIARFAKDATRFDKLDLPADQRRQMTLLKTSLVMATPADPKEAEELTTIMARLEATYGKGKWCPEPAKPEDCLNIDDITKVMATSRDPKRLREVWEGWHTISPPMRKDYARFVELSNKGGKELGFADTGAMWRAKYDMPPDDFTKELDRLWDQVRPLYLKLHAYVRMKLHEKYGDLVPATGPIPAYLLGNIWAQDWTNVYPLVAPAERRPRLLAHRHPEAPEDDAARHGPRRRALLHVARIRAAAEDVLGTFAVRAARRIATSSATRARGTSTSRPTCASRCASTRRPRTSRPSTTSSGTTSTSAPTRRSRCSSATAPTTASTKPSATRSRCRSRRSTWSRSGCSTRRPDASRDIGLLMDRALEKVAFLPFGLLIDQWRWKVFSGEVTPEQYNKAWWDLRLKYQGIAPPTARGEELFDPGAKYHVPDNTPYTRYFLAVHPAVPVPSRPVEDRRLHGAAAPLLDLREQGGRPAPERDAVDGPVAAVAGRARGADGHAADGRDRDPRLLRAAVEAGWTSSSRANRSGW